MVHEVSCEFGGKTLTLQTGALARQAQGAVLASFGDTRVLATVCAQKEPKDVDFLPLTVEYSERFYAAGKIPGSFFRREGRPTSEATLSARMIDRPIRPLFPENFHNEIQVVAMILSLDPAADPDVAAGAAVSAALHISEIPFNGPTAACRVGRVNGELIACPTFEQVETGQSDLEILVAGTAQAITMVEGGAREVPEKDLLEAILYGHEQIKKITKSIDELRAKCGVPKWEIQAKTIDTSFEKQVINEVQKPINEALKIKEKQTRYETLAQTLESALTQFVPETLKDQNPKEATLKEKQIKTIFENQKYTLMRKMVLDEKSRIDGRNLTTIRPIRTEVALLPRAHGSALFTRGETQILAAVTLGTADDEQIVDSLFQNTMRKFMLHYNFPPFSVGEVGRLGGQSRREIGHGALAERAIKAMAPKHEDFPYTIRIVCETLESNGSSSMGSVCSASMALMDAGIPFPKPVAGIAMGLIKESDRVAVLSDILGDEDHLGDMDFKVAGTAQGVTAIQMDIKIEGVSREILDQALRQAHEGRLHILGEMAKSIEQPRAEMSNYAPRITSLLIPKSKIAAVIGPGGKVIKEIIALTNCKIDIQDDGRINVASNNPLDVKKALSMIEEIIAEVEVGKTYRGTVTKVVDFGAFVAVLRNAEGLLHISEIAHERVRNVTDYLQEGDEVEVKVLEVDPDSGKIRLSRKALLPGGAPAPSGGGGPNRGAHGGGPGRGGPRGGSGGSRTSVPPQARS